MTHDPHHAELLDSLLRPENHRTFWTIYARRASDFATVEDERSTEEEAYEHAQYYYANGYGVRVHRVKKVLVADWEQDDTKEDK